MSDSSNDLDQYKDVESALIHLIKANFRWANLDKANLNDPKSCSDNDGGKENA